MYHCPHCNKLTSEVNTTIRELYNLTIIHSHVCVPCKIAYTTNQLHHAQNPCNSPKLENEITLAQILHGNPNGYTNCHYKSKF